MGETQKLQAIINKLQKTNEDLKAKVSKAESRSTQTSVGQASTRPMMSVNIHWNEEDESNDMSNDEHPTMKAH